tara:strand:- start:1494 stop:2267 length:774 start_codon:yes stop_codon:yes gene_type:complete
MGLITEFMRLAAGEAGHGELALGAGIVFVAFFVRGYTGFGASLIAVGLLTFIWPPAQVVPVLFLLEILASAVLLPGVWRDVQWRALSWLWIGAAFAMPVGLYVLANVPADIMSLSIAALIGVAATVLLLGVNLRFAPGRAATLATGGLVGLLNGASAIGGPPAVLFFFSNAAGIVSGRASLIAFFLVLDVIAAGFASVQGLYDLALVARAFALAPFMLIGAFAGAHAFGLADPETVRRAALVLLICVAVFRLLGGIF